MENNFEKIWNDIMNGVTNTDIHIQQVMKNLQTISDNLDDLAKIVENKNGK